MICPNSPDTTVLNVHSQNFDIGKTLQRTHLDSLFAHQCSGTERIDDSDTWSIETTKNYGLVNIWHQLFDFRRCDDSRTFDAPRLS